jgi:hypothetical protein
MKRVPADRESRERQRGTGNDLKNRSTALVSPAILSLATPWERGRGCRNSRPVRSFSAQAGIHTRDAESPTWHFHVNRSSLEDCSGLPGRSVRL